MFYGTSTMDPSRSVSAAEEFEARILLFLAAPGRPPCPTPLSLACRRDASEYRSG